LPPGPFQMSFRAMNGQSFRHLRRSSAAILAAALALAGCGGHFEVPVPILSAPAVPPPTAEPATITLPIAIALSKIRTQLDSVFPPADSLDRAKCTAMGGLVCHQYLYRRDSLDLRASGDRVTLQTHLRCGIAWRWRHRKLRLSAGSDEEGRGQARNDALLAIGLAPRRARNIARNNFN
jgi:hypothetical protein